MKLIKYGIEFKRTALKDLEGIPGKDSIRIINEINRLHDGLIEGGILKSEIIDKQREK